MTVFNVNIYIETSIKGPRAGRAAGAYVVEYITGRGIPVTRSGILMKERTTENALVLELLVTAFSELAKTCSVRVNTECAHVLHAVGNRWIERWERNGWKNAKGKEAGNAKLWQALQGKMKNHLVEFGSGPHSYRLLMQEELLKKMEGEGK